MEALAVLFVLAFLAVPLVALGLAIGARRRVARLEEEGRRRAQEIETLRANVMKRLAAVRPPAEEAREAEVAVAAEAAPAITPSAVKRVEAGRERPTPGARPAAIPAPAVRAPAEQKPPAAPVAALPGAAAEAPHAPPVEVPAIVAATPAELPAAVRLGGQAPPTSPVFAPPPLPPPEAPAEAGGFDWEGLVGVKLFSWIAGIALVLAAVFFLRYSIQQGWLLPPVRMAISLLVGVGLLTAGIVLGSHGARVAAIVLLVVTILKCLLHDLARLGGLYRVGSFVGLAVCLALVAIVLQRFVLAPRPRTVK